MREAADHLRRLVDSPRGARQVLLLFVALTLLAIVLQTWLAIRQDKLLTLKAEQEHGLTAVRLLEAHAKQIFNDAAENIDALERAIESARGEGPADDALIRKVLTQAQPFNRMLTSFQFVDRQGVAAVSSIDYPAYQTDADDRSYIPRLLAQPDLMSPLLGRPFARFYDGELILPLARNLSTADGGHHGLLSTDISVSRFANFYLHIARDSNALVALLSDEGFVVISVPQQDAAPGTDVSAWPVAGEAHALATEGMFESGNFLDGGQQTERLYFYKRVEGFPVTAIYARQQADVLAPWHTRTRDRIVFSLAILAFVTVLSLFLLWHIGRLDASRQSLRRSESKFTAIFQHSPVPLALLRLADDQLIEANDAMLQQFGYSASEILGRTPDQLGLWARPADRQLYLQRLRRERHLLRYPASMIDRQGQLMHCLVSAQVFDAEDGPIAIFSAVDETQQREAERRLKQLEQQLREAQKMEAIGTLAGGIAHDFNNILAAILGNVGMARQDVPAGHGVRDFLDQINKAALRARDLVQQILAFSRRQAHQLLVQPLRPIVEESLSLLRATLPARVILRLELSEEPLWLETDATQLQQVLMNLCTNAWHALHDSSGQLTVGYARCGLGAGNDPRLAQLPAGDYVHLWVADTGVGMSEELQTRVFEPFFTTKPVGMGTGLGLSVVHGIVAAHGGAITVDSGVGQGTRFNIYLPLSEPAVDPLAPESAFGGLQGAARGHLIYLDDDEVMLLMVERLLTRRGYRVSCFQQAGQALDALARAGSDIGLFVTDFNMPDMSGLEVAALVAARRPELPIIISSGYISEELLAGAQRVGARSVLQKQNTLEELPGLIDEHMLP